MEEGVIQLAGLSAARGTPVASPEVGDSLEKSERQLILKTLDQCGGDKKKAAQLLGISLKTLYNRLHIYAAS